MLSAALEWVEATPIAIAMQQSAWLFPIAETAHVVALSLMVGTIAIVDIRIMGAGLLEYHADRLTAALLPWTWLAFGMCAATGLLRFASSASRYAENPAFLLKIALLLLAGLNLVVFHLGAYRRVSEWCDQMRPPTAARIAGGVSLALWIAIVAAGRWIGFAG